VTHSAKATHHGGAGAGFPASHPVTRHRTKHSASAGASTTAATVEPPCDSAVLALSVSAPTAAGDHSALTLSVLNTGAAACTISGFPAVQFTGDTAVSATPTAETPTQLSVSAGATATAEVDWDGATTTGTCASYANVQASVFNGAATVFPLDPPAQVCDVATFVTHPFTAG
jgi:hypothetical protein